jgi:hypothetical protein
MKSDPLLLSVMMTHWLVLPVAESSSSGRKEWSNARRSIIRPLRPQLEELRHPFPKLLRRRASSSPGAP